MRRAPFHCRIDQIAYEIRDLEQVRVVEMGIARRILDLGVAEQLLGHRQRQAEPRGAAGGMARARPSAARTARTAPLPRG